MATTKAQQRAVHKYVKEKYDRLELTMPKGKKAEIKAHAESQGESVNGFVNRAIDEAMERDNKTPLGRIEIMPPYPDIIPTHPELSDEELDAMIAKHMKEDEEMTEWPDV